MGYAGHRPGSLYKCLFAHVHAPVDDAMSDSGSSNQPLVAGTDVNFIITSFWRGTRVSAPKEMVKQNSRAF